MSEETPTTPRPTKMAPSSPPSKSSAKPPKYTPSQKASAMAATRVVVRTFRVVDAEGSSRTNRPGTQNLRRVHPPHAGNGRRQPRVGPRSAKSPTRAANSTSSWKNATAAAALVEHCVPATPHALLHHRRRRQRPRTTLETKRVPTKSQTRQHPRAAQAASIFHFADPAHVGKTDTSANDLFELGNILFELVEHKKFDAVTPAASTAWTMGPPRRSKTPLDRILRIPPQSRRLPGITPRRKKTRRPPQAPSKVVRGILAAGFLGAAVFGGFFVINTLRHNQQPERDHLHHHRRRHRLPASSNCESNPCRICWIKTNRQGSLRFA